jgi:hypothetical protein
VAVEGDVTEKPAVPVVPAAPPAPPAKLPLKARLKAIFQDYPKVAIVTYLVLSAISVAGFSIAIGIGAEPSTATGVLGVIGAGWLAAKVTVPLRILATIGLTPPIAALLQKFWPKKPQEDPLPDDDDDD